MIVKTSSQRGLGWVLALVAAAGLAQAVRAGIAQSLYADIKFGGRQDVPFAQVAGIAERAHRLCASTWLRRLSWDLAHQRRTVASAAARRKRGASAVCARTPATSNCGS
jgi:hypothetical protein